jgi:hypothetical protein
MSSPSLVHGARHDSWAHGVMVCRIFVRAFRICLCLMQLDTLLNYGVLKLIIIWNLSVVPVLERRRAARDRRARAASRERDRRVTA